MLTKLLVRDRSGEARDEIDVASILQRRHLRMRSRPFLGGQILVLVGSVELDLRRVLPAPTGIEIEVLVIGGMLRVVVPPGWRRDIGLTTRAASIDLIETPPESDAPLFRLVGQAWLSRVEVVERGVPSAVTSPAF